LWDHVDLFSACPRCYGSLREVLQGAPFPSQPSPAPLPEPARPIPKKVPEKRTTGSLIAPYLYLFTTVVFAGALALDPFGRIFIVPLVALFVLLAITFLVLFVRSLPEAVALFRDRRNRVAHGLEHACIAILEENGHPTFGGITKKGRFLVGVNYSTSYKEVERAVREAIRRFAVGESELAYSPRCGTSAAVGSLLFALTIVGCTIAAIGFGIGIGPAFMAAAILGCFAMLFQKPLGIAAQKYLTVSARFSHVSVGEIRRDDYGGGQTAFAVPLTVTL
jgi:hypothetical protein